MSSMVLVKEATAQSQEEMIILDITKIDFVGYVESNKTVVV